MLGIKELKRRLKLLKQQWNVLIKPLDMIEKGNYREHFRLNIKYGCIK
jgi:hypothetical protein